MRSSSAIQTPAKEADLPDAKQSEHDAAGHNMRVEVEKTKSLLDQPQNGLAGLKHWRHDMLAGLVVALVSVPLSLGIALASGAPPVCGLTSEIIAGLIFPLIGGAYVTISGPAAGLAPILYSSIAALGHGDMTKGYQLVLGVIMFAGLTQIVLTKLNAAKFSYLIPRSAIHGMLAAIGLMIIVKQIPNFMGQKFEAHETFGLIAEIPSHFALVNAPVLLIAIVCLTVLLLLSKIKIKPLQLVPPHLAVVVIGIGLGQFFRLDPTFLVAIPQNPLQHGIVFPDFAGLFSSPTLIPTIIFCVFALTLVDGCESLATIHAIDQIDPFHRKSNPNRTLLAMGVSNVCSSLVGGLTIIPGAIKSATNIVAGGRTAWVNFYNAVFLIVFLVFFHEMICRIPVAALSAVLVHIGFKLAGPEKWHQALELGWDQFAVFSTVVTVTMCSDLLVGIACGIGVKILLLAFFLMRCHDAQKRHASLKQHLIHAFTSIFRNPISRVTEVSPDLVEVHFGGPVTCFNNLFVRDTFEEIGKQNKLIKLCFDPSVKVVDHSSTVFLKSFKDDRHRVGLSEVTMVGLDRLCACSPDAARYKLVPR